MPVFLILFPPAFPFRCGTVRMARPDPRLPTGGRRKDWFHPMIMDRIALILSIIGALNWGSIGLFQFDIVAWICGGSASLLARIIYTVVALAGVWCISLLFRTRETFDELEDPR